MVGDLSVMYMSVDFGVDYDLGVHMCRLCPGFCAV